MTVKVKVIYPADVPIETALSLDEIITEKIESLGAVWYGQGRDFTSNERDISFDLDIDIEGDIESK